MYLKNNSVRHTEQSEVSINTYELSGNGFFTSFRMTIKCRRKNVYPWNTDIILRRKNVYLRNISIRHTEQSEGSINTYELSGNGLATLNRKKGFLHQPEDSLRRNGNSSRWKRYLLLFKNKYLFLSKNYLGSISITGIIISSIEMPPCWKLSLYRAIN